MRAPGGRPQARHAPEEGGTRTRETPGNLSRKDDHGSTIHRSHRRWRRGATSASHRWVAQASLDPADSSLHYRRYFPGGRHSSSIGKATEQVREKGLPPRKDIGQRWDTKATTKRPPSRRGGVRERQPRRQAPRVPVDIDHLALTYTHREVLVSKMPCKPKCPLFCVGGDFLVWGCRLDWALPYKVGDRSHTNFRQKCTHRRT